MLNMGDSSSVQMPQMIQPPSISGRAPSAERTAESTPQIQPPRRATTRKTVRLPLMVRIVPEARLTAPTLARNVHRTPAAKGSR